MCDSLSAPAYLAWYDSRCQSRGCRCKSCWPLHKSRPPYNKLGSQCPRTCLCKCHYFNLDMRGYCVRLLLWCVIMLHITHLCTLALDVDQTTLLGIEKYPSEGMCAPPRNCLVSNMSMADCFTNCKAHPEPINLPLAYGLKRFNIVVEGVNLLN